MKNEMHFLWLDDKSAREQDVTTLEKNFGIKITFISLEKKDLIIEITDIIKKNNELDLIMMDHKLDKINDTFISTGSAVTEILHGKWPEYPIVCVTGVDSDKEIFISEKAIYDGIFNVSNLSENFETIITIAKSFKKLRNQKPKNIDELIKMLDVPEDDRTRLKEILPADITMHFEDTRLSSIICKWVRNVLIERPGFLFDDLWAATLFGIKKKSFYKVEKIFKDALYKGIFADNTHPRWWQSKLREILYSSTSKSDSPFPWIRGKDLKHIKKSDYSQCHVCGTENPEIVAYTDEKKQDRAPMHLRCTISHPNAEQLLFFEEIRIMKV